MKKLKLLFAVIGLAAAPLYAMKDPKPTEQKKEEKLSQEERDMLKDREMLENLELLKGFEKFSFLDLFSEADKDPKENATPAPPETKKDERKK